LKVNIGGGNGCSSGCGVGVSGGSSAAKKRAKNGNTSVFVNVAVVIRHSCFLKGTLC
jgi:hypothetical protein